MSPELFNNRGDTPIELLERFPGNVELFIKREDLIHPVISGNKWRKLKYNIIEAIGGGYSRILTFGGAFSNHIHATAAAGAACGLDTVGVIRGEIVDPPNHTLSQARDWGMRLVNVTRQEYRNKSTPEFLNQLTEKFGKYYLIPEGGTNALALKGCAEMTVIEADFNYWCVSCGTGGTLAGIISGLKGRSRLIGFPALKGGGFLEQEISNHLLNAGEPVPDNWELILNYHFGGYAKISVELVEFIKEFYSRYQILLDPVYTGKMLFGVIDLIKKGFFKANTRILAIHTGGLQGITGIEKKYGIKIN